MIKLNRIAYGVRVKLNENFVEKCLGDKYLKDEKVLFIRDEKPYNDDRGYYVHVTGGSLTNSGYAYLNELDLEFEVPEHPMYVLYGEEKTEPSDDIILSRKLLTEDLESLQEKWKNIDIDIDPMDDEYRINYFARKANLYGKIIVHREILGLK